MLLLEAAINRYLALDPEVPGKLSQFNGKVIKLALKGIDKEFYILPDENGLQVLTSYEGPVDTVLRGTPIALFKMGLVSRTANLLLKGEVEISGDTRLGHQFKNVLSQMEIDWSEPLANIVGDGLAFQIQQSGSKLSRWGKTSARSVATSLSEYLQEESRDVVTGTELNMFYHEVDQLRNDVDRLQAKINTILTT